jgi:hypothetical protein
VQFVLRADYQQLCIFTPFGRRARDAIFGKVVRVGRRVV